MGHCVERILRAGPGSIGWRCINMQKAENVSRQAEVGTSNSKFRKSGPSIDKMADKSASSTAS